VLDRDGLEAAVLVALRDEIPGYARVPDAVLETQVADAVNAALRLVSRPGEPLGEDELEVFRESARARAGEGVALDDVLRAYRVGGRVAWEALVAAAAGPAQRDALPAAASVLMAYVDQLSSAASATYLDERQYRLAEDARLVAELIEVLASERPVPEGLRALVARLGASLLEVYRPFALARPGRPATAHSQAAASLRLQGVLAMTEGEAVIGLIDPEADAALLRTGHAVVALGEPVRRPALRVALQDVRLVLSIARRRGIESGLVDAVELAVPLLVAGSPRLGELVRRRVIGPLEAYEGGRSGELLRTLRAYFATSLNRGRAAAALGVHPNTLDYRLGRIEELCAVRLSDPRDIARIELALAQLDLEP
jgi:hypothetical protein